MRYDQLALSSGIVGVAFFSSGVAALVIPNIDKTG